jgi:phosphoserine phosphatase
VILVDGDGTLTPVDSSRLVLSRAGIDPGIVKARFQALGYCFEAFRVHTQTHLEIAPNKFDVLCAEIGSETKLHAGAEEFLRAAAELAVVAVVSAGIPVVWRHILSNAKITDVHVVGGIDPARPVVVGRVEKGRLARQLVNGGSRVIAIGDSDVDTEMLAVADEAVIVVNHRQNKDLLPQVASHRSVWQVVPQGVAHEGIRLRTFSNLHELIGQTVG